MAMVKNKWEWKPDKKILARPSNYKINGRQGFNF